ncbi:gliding motility-associated C-terminal domain-containing protein [Flavobacterium chilense]|uniref:Gliding motility-associated C-terminal domain-containing protein n=1 Tax=Flavobacterium chilense TaxID=946677 RepID=A0A1M7MVL0_9FLAO|nr:gliding motility-associated C-terminal domain-containing protein [Flavobacterium chilense]SHM95062.1 gliding motility-associated C-terminal domain-containing protein [Flavobacterium chilense]
MKLKILKKIFYVFAVFIISFIVQVQLGIGTVNKKIMKNYILHKIAMNADKFSFYSKKSTYISVCLIILFAHQKAYSQFLNQGNIKINSGTLVSVYFDYKNTVTGNFINDGEVHVFENWDNDGIVTYTTTENGKTFFTGTTEQIIEGTKTSDFQNIIFNNQSTAVPFHLASTIAVGKLADFTNGIINAKDYSGLVVFKKDAFHIHAGNQSFVNGQTENNIDEPFEFPVGDAQFFRPAFYTSNSAQQTIYTSQYFYKNSADIHPHTSKEDSILLIDDKEYWNIIQNQGTEKIVLSLTLSKNTTPSAFYNLNPDTELVIVRWDEATSKWVNDGGVLSEPISGETYSNLLTGQVSGYGLFTMAVVKKSNIPTDDLIVYNAISPNGDGINDTFYIKGIDKYPDNTVEIYNRWGVKVYEASAYNENDIVFKGYSDGRATINRENKLPTGTYFYILKYNNAGKMIKKAGYLYINND